METKGVNRDLVLAGCAALGGLSCGLLAGYLLSRHFQRKSFEARLASETEAIKRHYDARHQGLVNQLRKGERPPAVATIADVEAIERPDITVVGYVDTDGTRHISPVPGDSVPDGSGSGHSSGEEGSSSLQGSDEGEDDEDDGDDEGDNDYDDDADLERPPDLEPDELAVIGPYLITEDEYAEDHQEYSKNELQYYGDDGVLVDERETPLLPYEMGALLPLGFEKEFESGKQLIHVRNQRLNSDFEITFVNNSYADTVLNYGNPGGKPDGKMRR